MTLGELFLSSMHDTLLSSLKASISGTEQSGQMSTVKNLDYYWKVVVIATERLQVLLCEIRSVNSQLEIWGIQSDLQWVNGYVNVYLTNE